MTLYIFYNHIYNCLYDLKLYLYFTHTLLWLICILHMSTIQCLWLFSSVNHNHCHHIINTHIIIISSLNLHHHRHHYYHLRFYHHHHHHHHHYHYLHSHHHYITIITFIIMIEIGTTSIIQIQLDRHIGELQQINLQNNGNMVGYL